MGDQVPLVMPLDDAGAMTSVAGGKGASLGRLARAGFLVPARVLRDNRRLPRFP